MSFLTLLSVSSLSLLSFDSFLFNLASLSLLDTLISSISRRNCYSRFYPFSRSLSHSLLLLLKSSFNKRFSRSNPLDNSRYFSIVQQYKINIYDAKILINKLLYLILQLQSTIVITPSLIQL